MKKMTNSELKPIFSDYASWLGEWQPVGKDKLVRINEPIVQGLWLDRLRTGYYRPCFFIRVLTTPRKGGADLLHYLSIKRREINPKRHDELFEEIKAEANRDVFPPLKKQLDAQACLNGLENRITDNPAQLASVASLAAYFGDTSKYQSFRNAFFSELDARFTSTKDKWICDYGSFFEGLDGNRDARNYLQPIIDRNMKAEGYEKDKPQEGQT